MIKQLGFYFGAGIRFFYFCAWTEPIPYYNVIADYILTFQYD